jgi:cytochrome c biogenesis protein CcdA
MRQLAEIVIITGMVTFFGSQWWLAGRAFRRSVFWGLAVLFVPGGALAFLFGRWQYARRPFLAMVAGAALMMIGAVIYTRATKDTGLIAKPVLRTSNGPSVSRD